MKIKLLILKILRCVGCLSLKYKGCKVGHGVNVLGLVDVKRAPRSLITIGDGVSLLSKRWANPLRPNRSCSLVTLTSEASITIGNPAGLSSTVLSCRDSIVIGEGTMIGADCLIVDNDFHEIPLGSDNRVKSKPVEIGSKVFIGARSIILKGVHIGDGSVIGAGSVVSTDVPCGSVYAGNPARLIKVLDS